MRVRMEFRYIVLKGKEIRFKCKSREREREREIDRESIIITAEKIEAIGYFAQYTKSYMY